MALIGFGKPEIITDAQSRLMTNRRSFLIGAGASLIVAPSIVRAASLMNVRGEPLRQLDEFLLCDGRIIGEDEDPVAFGIIEGEIEAQKAAFAAVRGYIPNRNRRYGGSVKERTFALPDFTPFKDYFGEHINFELDRKGELYLTDTITGEREKL